MNQHVHNSRYFDYVLAARYDQMARCYKMSMAEFINAGFGWVVRAAHVEYKRPLVLDDTMTVATWVEAMMKDGVNVRFEIRRNRDGKLSCEGWFDYAMVDLQNGRAAKIPDWIAEKYAI